MAEVTLVKVHGALAPYDAEAEVLLSKIKQGRPVRCKIVRIRSYEFHRKFFALVNIAFDVWSELYPPTKVSIRGKEYEVAPNRERFRKDLTILAGYYEATYTIKGEVRVEAESISFDAMDQDEFEKLFSSCINVILGKVLTNTKMTDEQLRARVDEVLRFDQGGR
jgi:uncharacterized protein DUF1367